MITRIDSNKRMSKAVEHNNTIYFSGIVSDNKENDIKVQAKRVIEIIEERMKLANTSKDKLLRADVFLKNIGDDFIPFNEVWDAWINGENQPTRACVQANMASKETLVEVIFLASK